MNKKQLIQFVSDGENNISNIDLVKMGCLLNFSMIKINEKPEFSQLKMLAEIKMLKNKKQKLQKKKKDKIIMK